MRYLVSSAGVDHQFTDDRTKHHDDRQFPQRVAETCFHGVQQRHQIHTGQHPDGQRRHQQSHHRIDFELQIQYQHQANAEYHPENVKHMHNVLPYLVEPLLFWATCYVNWSTIVAMNVTSSDQ